MQYVTNVVRFQRQPFLTQSKSEIDRLRAGDFKLPPLKEQFRTDKIQTRPLILRENRKPIQNIQKQRQIHYAQTKRSLLKPRLIPLKTFSARGSK